MLTSPASPSRKGFTHFALITWPNKGVYTSYKDLAKAKQDQFWSTYKGFNSAEEAHMTLKLQTIDEEKIKMDLALEPKAQIHTYVASGSIPAQINPNILLAKFGIIQEFLFEVHSEAQNYNGLFVKTQTYFNPRNPCVESLDYCKTVNIDCTCQIKFIIRRAQIDLKTFNNQLYRDLVISPQLLLEAGCLQTISIPPTNRFHSLTPEINSIVNEIQAEHMNNVLLHITSSTRSAISSTSTTTHVIKLYTDMNPETQALLEHDPLKGLSLNKDKLYQYELWKAYIEGSNWNFSKKDVLEFILLKETADTKLYWKKHMGNKFYPFPIEASPVLLKHFEKERIYKEIYEQTGNHGQETPGASFPSDNEDPDYTDHMLEEELGDLTSIAVTRRC